MQVRTQFRVNLICATMLKKKRKMVRFNPDQEKELFKHRGSLLLLNRKEFYFCHCVLLSYAVSLCNALLAHSKFSVCI